MAGSRITINFYDEIKKIDVSIYNPEKLKNSENLFWGSNRDKIIKFDSNGNAKIGRAHV